MRKPHFDLKGLRFNIWFYFAIYAFLICVILWLLQIVFLRKYYENLEQKSIVRIGEKLVSSYGEAEKFNELAADAVRNNRATVVVISREGGILYGDPDQFDQTSLAEFAFQMKTSQDGKVNYIERGTWGNSLVYGAIVGETTSETLGYIYLRAPLAPVETTTRVLQNQLLFVSIILLVLGFVISWYVSKQLGKPIAEISREAKKLGSGDYTAHFTGNGYTEIDELSNTLNYAAGELQKTDELRKELMANVSHDLRTPLTMVKAYAEMIRDISGNNPIKRAEHAEVIIEEADRLSLLVNDILTLSRLERGSVQESPADFSLSDTCRKVLAHFSYLEEREGYSIRGEIEEGLSVCAQEMRIEQVIYNLVSNAVNYTGEDKTVTVRLFSAGEIVRFEVKDTGAGIPEEQKRDIWDRYYRSKETHKRPVVGTGLGLSIVKNILQQHGANFGVDSRVGAGSTFWFEMKRANCPQ